MDEMNNQDFTSNQPEMPKQPEPSIPAQFTQPNDPFKSFSLNLSMSELKSITSWATFRAIIDIIVGALSCLGFFLVFPAVYGVFTILGGVKLLNSVDSLKRYIAANDLSRISETLQYMGKFFKFNGIATIIKICFGIIGIIVYVIFIAYVMSNASELDNFFREFSNMGTF